ncbi:MAG: DUF3489 domain-containing protein [Prosthecobacter sp.]|nr:DUF3489 domain-containing protein [Prosthecobacter sp.]
MPKLTDTQLVILNAAAARSTCAIFPLSKPLKFNKGTANSVLKGLLTKGFLEERPATPRAETWRKDEAGKRYMLVISEAGLAALEGGGTASTMPQRADAKPLSKLRKAVTVQRPSRSQPETSKNVKHPRGKTETILVLLQRRDGAALNELETATGWQPHSVRAALTGLRKRDIDILREKQDGVTRYKVAAA